MIGQKRTGSREGGVEVVVTELAIRMAALGHEVVCYDRSGTDINGNVAPSKPYDFNGVRIVPVRTINAKGLSALSSAYFATRLAIRDCPDVIHYHAEGPSNALPLAHKAGIRTVTTIHGLDWKRAKWSRAAAHMIKRGERAAARTSDEVIVLSRAVQDYFLDEYNRDTMYIPNGVEVKHARIASVINDRWGLKSGSYVLYLGRLVPEKRVDLLLEAFRNVNTDKRLVLAGGSSDTADYVEHIKLMAKNDPRVVLTGFVDGELVSELYSNAYCYVLPSDVEGMPMSLLEAMSYGCCCLTSDIAECVEVLGSAGHSFSTGSAYELTRSLNELIENPSQLKQLGEKARNRVKCFHNWNSIVEKTLSLYSERVQ